MKTSCTMKSCCRKELAEPQTTKKALLPSREKKTNFYRRLSQEEKDKLAHDVVARMMRDDLFSQWLGIEVMKIKEGYSKIKMTIRKEMINGFGVVHGGIAFSL